jgi:hypothetical protein
MNKLSHILRIVLFLILSFDSLGQSAIQYVAAEEFRIKPDTNFIYARRIKRITQVQLFDIPLKTIKHAVPTDDTLYTGQPVIVFKSSAVRKHLRRSGRRIKTLNREIKQTTDKIEKLRLIHEKHRLELKSQRINQLLKDDLVIRAPFGSRAKLKTVTSNGFKNSFIEFTEVSKLLTFTLVNASVSTIKRYTDTLLIRQNRNTVKFISIGDLTNDTLKILSNPAVNTDTLIVGWINESVRSSLYYRLPVTVLPKDYNPQPDIRSSITLNIVSLRAMHSVSNKDIIVRASLLRQDSEYFYFTTDVDLSQLLFWVQS